MNDILVVVATLVAKPGHEATLKAALERVVPPSRAEAGCLRYELNSDNEQPGRFLMLEQWRDHEALRQHEATAHFQALVKSIAGLADVQLSKLSQIA